MKKVKKIIVLLIAMIAIIALNVSTVDAARIIPNNNGKISVNELRRNRSYRIGFQEYHNNNNIFCVQKGQRLWSSRTTYKLIAKIEIENSTSKGIPVNGGRSKEVSTESSKVSKDYNRKLATAIVKLGNNKEKMKSFMWGFFDTWVEKVGHPYYKIPSAFAKTTELNSFDKVDDQIEKEIKDSVDSVDDDFKSITNEEKIAFKDVKINNKDYIRIGPYQVSGIPSVGLKNLVIKDQNNKKIEDAKIVRYYDDELTVVGVDKIKNEKNFYICIPKDKEITKVSATLTTEKVKTEGVKATIYLFQSSYANWQNLVVPEGKTITGRETNLEEDLPTVTIPGDLTIIKKDAFTNQPLQGATFVIYRYVKDDDGSWYKKGDAYTQTQSEATDKNTKYKREYIAKPEPYTYHKKALDDIRNNSSYLFTTNNEGKITLKSLKPATYFATEIKAPKNYKAIQGGFVLGKVESGKGTTKTVTNEPDVTNMDLIKVNKNDHKIVLSGVEFKFRHEVRGWLKQTNGKYEYTANENEATWFKTDANGKIHLEGLFVGNWTYQENPKTLPYGYDITGKEKGTFKLESKDTNTVTIENEQKWVKLSGYVWVDKVNSKDSDAKNRNDIFDPKGTDYLLDGITVRLKNSETNQVWTTTTSYRGLYTENNGHGEYLFENVRIVDLPYLYIEFEYDGLTYTNIPTKIAENNGSKAAEGERRRNNFNAGFSVIEGSGEREKGYAKGNGTTKELQYSVSNYTATLNNKGNYTIQKDNHGDFIKQESLGAFPIQADTDQGDVGEGKDPSKEQEDNYIYGRSRVGKHFAWGQTEIKYINLGLKDRDQPDIALMKDIHNVKVEVNGNGHTYEYNQGYQAPTYDNDKNAFNVGVQFKNKVDGSYNRVIYKADRDYIPDNKDNELKVYITYELKMIQSNINLKAKVNSIAEYFDSKYEITKIGTALNEDKSIGGTIIQNPAKEPINDKYAKAIIPCDVTLEPQKETSIFVQFKLSRDNVIKILGDKDSGYQAPDEDLLNNVAEINSYSIFDKKGNPYAAVDMNSNPGDCTVEKPETYENDTSAAPGLRLVVGDAREMTGTVFEDDVIPEKGQDATQVMTGKERKGNGIYDDQEKGIGGVDITLKEATSGMTYHAVTVPEDGYYQIEKDDTKTVKKDDKEREYTFTATKLDQNDGKTNTHELKKGDFYIIGYIPGNNYTLTYTWGDKTYTVQNYKGTIYNQPERKDNKKWWYVDKDEKGKVKNPNDVIRYSDAKDSYPIRKDIDAEIMDVKKDTNANIEKAYQENAQDNNIITKTKMESTTEPMKIDVEYNDVYSASQGDKYAYRIDNIDFGIVERPKQQLALTKRINSLKATLANGQVIVDVTIDEKGNITGDRSALTYMKPSPSIEPSNGFIRLELDNELIQGTKLEVGYEMKATNQSELDYATEGYYLYGDRDKTNVVTISATGMMDYLDKNWSFDPTMNQTWKVMSANGGENDISNLVKEEVIQDANSTIGKKTILYTEMLKEESLQPGATSKDPAVIKVSKTLTTTDEISLDNEAEEVTASKSGGATLRTTLGNYIPGAGAKEADNSMAETTIVTPATGENLNYILPVIIGTTALVVLGAGIILIKKKTL